MKGDQIQKLIELDQRKREADQKKLKTDKPSCWESTSQKFYVALCDGLNANGPISLHIWIFDPQLLGLSGKF